LLDAWSLTSIMKPMPGRPEIAPFLHGLERELPETYIAWRKEVTLLGAAGVNAERLGDWFQSCRIEARELLRDRTGRVKKALHDLLNSHREKDKLLDFPVMLLDERGNAECCGLSEIVEKEFKLAYRTIVLPVEAGGLQSEYGMLDGNAVAHQAVDMDVAETPDEEDGEGRRERWFFIQTGDGAPSWRRLLTGETLPAPPAGLRETEAVTLEEAPEGAEVDAVVRRLMLMVGMQRAASQSPETVKIRQTLAQHSETIEHCIGSITLALRLDPRLGEALVAAALRHDNGKARPIWQRFACNPDPSIPLAKSTKFLHGRTLGGYRHEFGSLMEAAMNLGDHPERDLILHLIAAHHGWARPQFEPTSLDNTYKTEDNERAAIEVLRRFGQLQRRFGRWGLAWLEAILRCADIAASKQPSEAPATTCIEELQA
jgi:CRISPR-associated endonuclease/helicase Cas3